MRAVITCSLRVEASRIPVGNVPALMAIKSVGIIGSGIMGSGIAEVAAKAGCAVVLRSRRQETADDMVARLTKALDKQVERGRLEQAERDATPGRGSVTARFRDSAA